MPSHPSPKSKSKNNHHKVTSEGTRRTLRSTDNPGAARAQGGLVVRSQHYEEGERVEGQLPSHQVTGSNPTGNGDTQQSGRSKTLRLDLEVATTGPNHLDVSHEDEPMSAADTSRADTTGYEGEEQLDREHSEVEWKEFETRFQQTNMMIAFSIDEPTILVPQQGYWGLPELTTGITQVCESKGVVFESPGLMPTDGRITRLLGRPVAKDRALWKLLRRGYVKIHGATIWMSPDFTGRKQSNLDMIELEYSNANYMSVGDLHTVLQRWGAMEMIVVSHGVSRVRRGKWPAIACVNNAVTDPETQEPKFSFRLCFECNDTVNRVYRAFMEKANDSSQRVEDGRTVRLTPVHNVEWSAERHQMIRPSAQAELENLSRRLHLFGVSSELTINHIEEKLASLGYDGANVAIQAGRWWGTLVLRDEQSASRLYEAFGVQQHKRIFIGNIRLFVNRPGEDGGLRCFSCGVSGHFSRECRRAIRGQTRREPDRSYGGDNRQFRGRANSRWQAIARNAATTEELVPQGGRRELGRVENHRSWSNYERQDEMMKQFEPMMRAIVADQVRVQSQELVQSVQAQIQRHAQEVDTRIEAHDASIRTMQEAQQKTTSEVKGIASLLERMARHLKVPDFGEGGPAGGAGSQ